MGWASPLVVRSRFPAMLLAVALAARGLGAPAVQADEETLGVQVTRAVDRGVAYLRAQENADGSFRGEFAKQFPVGQTALALCALAKSQVDAAEPKMRAASDFVRGRPLATTYETAVSILALDALKDPAHDEWIRDAARWLEQKFGPEERPLVVPARPGRGASGPRPLQHADGRPRDVDRREARIPRRTRDVGASRPIGPDAPRAHGGVRVRDRSWRTDPHRQHDRRGHDGPRAGTRARLHGGSRHTGRGPSRAGARRCVGLARPSVHCGGEPVRGVRPHRELAVLLPLRRRAGRCSVRPFEDRRARVVPGGRAASAGDARHRRILARGRPGTPRPSCSCCARRRPRVSGRRARRRSPPRRERRERRPRTLARAPPCRT